MDADTPNERARIFAPFPKKGVWTAVGMSRGAFFLILVAASALYIFWGGPLWSHLGEDDFSRLLLSYAFIPIAVAVALARDGTLSLGNFLAATGILAGLKLLVTAALALLLDLDAMAGSV